MASQRITGRALRWAAWLATMVVACAAGPASATTIIPLGPGDLVATSLAAVRGRVTGLSVSRDAASGAMWTQVTIDPSEHLFGALPPGPITLRELGGRADGVEQRVFGAPEYRIGDDVIVFVSSDRHGRLHTTGLAMGAYHVDDTLGSARAIRTFGAEVAVLDPARGTIVQDAPDEAVDLAALRRSVDSAARLAGKGGARSLAGAAHLSLRIAPTAAFVLFNPAVRWFEPDDGLPIRYLIDPGGDATLGPDVSRAAVAAGLAQWSIVPNTSISLEDGGDTEPAPLGGCPDTTRIMFNDPFGELDAPTDCKGILGVTVVCDEDELRVVNGKTFRRISGTKTLINDGFGSCPFWNACSLSEILTHELGHTVGLGHSQLPAATMAARAHFDGRCASLTADDQNGLAVIYPLLPSPSPTPSATPPSPSTPTTTSTSTITATPTITPTMPTATVTRTGTNTRPPTRTLTPSYTVRPSRTVTPTWTRVPTRTTTASTTQTPSATASPSTTSTNTATPSASPSATASATTTASGTATASATASASSTATQTPSSTPTATTPPATPTATATATETASATPSATPPSRPSDRLAALITALRRLLAMLAHSI